MTPENFIISPSFLSNHRAEQNNTRSRNPVSPSKAISVRGKFPSKKMQRMIAWESQLEQRACYLFEFSDYATKFREQPKTFLIPTQENIKRYTPDFEIVDQHGKVTYIEIKPSHQIPENLQKFNAIDRFFKKNQCSFAVLTEIELIHPTIEQNLKLLRHHYSYNITSHHLHAINELKNNQILIISIHELAIYLDSYSAIYSLIAHKKIFIDICHSLLDEQALIFLEKPQNEQSLLTFRTAPYFA